MRCFYILSLFVSLLINDCVRAAHPMHAVYAEFEIEGGQKVAANWYHGFNVIFKIRWNPTSRKVLVNTGRGWMLMDKLSDEHQANIDAACLDAGLGVNAEEAAKTVGFRSFQDVKAYVIQSDLGCIPACRLTRASYNEMIIVLDKIRENYAKNQPQRDQIAALNCAERAARAAEQAARDAEWAARGAERAARDAEWQSQVTRDIYMTLNPMY